MSEVTVVVLTHNRAPDVRRTLGHLTALPEHPYLIVVDNGSSDGTPAAIRTRFASVEVVSLDRNLGAAGRNVGIERARTPYVALCDDDTWWAAGALGRAAALLDAHPGLALVTGRVLVGPEGREDPTCRAMAASPLPTETGLPGSPVLGFLAGASVVRRSAFLAVGGFDARFFLGGEEALVAVDLATAGWALQYVADVVAHHHPSPQRDARGRRRLLTRNALWFTWLRRPLASVRRRMRAIVGGALRDRAGAAGVIDAGVGLPWVLRERRVVPSHVEAGLRRLEIYH